MWKIVIVDEDTGEVFDGGYRGELLDLAELATGWTLGCVGRYLAVVVGETFDTGVQPAIRSTLTQTLQGACCVTNEPDDVLDGEANAKAAWVEANAVKKLESSIETEQILDRAVVHTFGWFTGIAVAAGGYLIKLWADGKLEPALSGGLASAATLATIAACYLMASTMMPKDRYTLGHSARLVTREEFYSRSLAKMRLAVSKNTDSYAEHNCKVNDRVADKLIIARWVLIFIPLVSIVLGAAIFFAYPYHHQNASRSDPAPAADSRQPDPLSRPHQGSP